MKNIYLILLILLCFGSCKEPQPRRPIQQKTATFLKESKERSIALLKKEEQLILEHISKDTLNQYVSNAGGFWYTLSTEQATESYLPKTDDELTLTYAITNLEGDTLYSKQEIGIVTHKVDKSKLFPGLRNAVKVLAEGNTGTFIFPSSLGYGYRGDTNRIGPNQILRAELSIIAIKKDSLNQL